MRIMFISTHMQTMIKLLIALFAFLPWISSYVLLAEHEIGQTHVFLCGNMIDKHDLDHPPVQLTMLELLIRK